MRADDLDYFRQRAEAELALARDSGHAGAARAHYLLAGYYLDLVHNREARAGAAQCREAADQPGLALWEQVLALIGQDPMARSPARA